MSSFIAVCVTFLGLALIIVNVAVFLQMLLSFPAMLSSNSQAYVQQQRKLHHIPSSPEDLDGRHAAPPEADGADAEDEQEWETTGRWTDEVEVEVEEDEEEGLYQAEDCSSKVYVAPRAAAAAARSDSMTRGRPLRRQRRRYIARTVLRVKDIGRVRDSDYDSEYSETERRPTVAGARSRDRAGHDCRGGWRGMDWTR
ncbi:hypothetical protein UCDDA912_g05979 [Diaporthe ampelina]|uniref:Uncharacterized protein n=1 Tax=Diaporthe ampelina TaxID=1214573 RepID=A0A0G2I1S4_9PEZI|nr:hypothetical protein UCDDA912_g05979 [Diaporthe ampelina]